jgi:hypothetical protein
MRVLFIVRRFSYLRNYEAPILQLARRGHTLHMVSVAGEGRLEGTAMLERWKAQAPGITFERLPAPPYAHSKASFRGRVSMMLDYLRFLDPAYGSSAGLIERARRRTPVGFLRRIESSFGRRPLVRRAYAWLLRNLELAAPRRGQLDDFLRAQAPDIVLFTPLIAMQSEEQDLLAAAVEQGLRTVFCVLSWDNLSSKALLRTIPDLVTVWNETQRDEARELHGVPDDRIAVTGAQSFDRWFNRAPSKPRAEFLARVGLPPDSPFLLWVCSALLRTSPMEAMFVRRWIEAVRASSDPALRAIPILVRPHPARMVEWSKVSLAGLEPVTLWGANPVDEESSNDYFDSLYYCAAIAGLNTSAFLEGAIVGKPVYTVLLPEYHESQEGTLHFPYLLQVAGGLLHAARDMDGHVADLSAALRRPDGPDERSRRFVAAFVRPNGLDSDATTHFIRVIEETARKPARSAASHRRRAAVLFTWGYAWLERQSRRGAARAWLISPFELELIRRRQARRARHAEKARYRAEKAQTLREHRAAKRAREERAREEEAART